MCVGGVLFIRCILSARPFCVVGYRRNLFVEARTTTNDCVFPRLLRDYWYQLGSFHELSAILHNVTKSSRFCIQVPLQSPSETTRLHAQLKQS